MDSRPIGLTPTINADVTGENEWVGTSDLRCMAPSTAAMTVTATPTTTHDSHIGSPGLESAGTRGVYVLKVWTNNTRTAGIFHPTGPRGTELESGADGEGR